MKVLLDTNVIMDALQERQPFDTEANDIFLRAQNDEFICCITANAVADVFYLCRRARDLKSARQLLSFLLTSYKILSITHEDCIYAMSIPIEDFEDALVSACAEKAEADYIISRDDMFLRGNSPVKVIEPKDFLKIITGTTGNRA